MELELKDPKDGCSEEQTLFLELLAYDIDTSLEDRQDAAEFWTLLKGDARSLLAFLLCISEKDLSEYLSALWKTTVEEYESIQDSAEEYIELDDDDNDDDSLETAIREL